MTAKLLNGKQLAAKKREQMQDKVTELKKAQYRSRLSCRFSRG